MFNRYLYPIYGYTTKFVTITVKYKTVHIPIRRLGVIRYEKKVGV
jgi:hypothetical protein